MANFFSKLLSSSASSLVDAVGDAIDKNVTSDEERKSLENELSKAKMQFDVDMATLGLKEQEAYLGDVASARDNQSRVQEAEHASWLAKNIQPLMAATIVGLTFWLYWYVISGKGEILKDNNMKDIVIYILGALTTVATQVVSYFFGSSKGSADKSAAILTMKNRE